MHGHLVGGLQRDLQAAGVDLAAAGQVQGGAVVDRGADNRQAKGDVHRRAEAFVLEHGQALIVVHGQHRIAVFQVLGGEQGVGGQRADQVQAVVT